MKSIWLARADWSPQRIAIGIVLVIAWIVSLGVALGQAFDGGLLGSHPTKTVALDASSWGSCLRFGCDRHADADILVAGQPLKVDLRGVNQDAPYYRAGIVVMYNTDDPSLAMADADYRDSTGSYVPTFITVATSICLIGAWAVMFVHVTR